MKTYTIGIDFGTTKTLVARVNPDTKEMEYLRLGRANNHMPTTIAIRDKGGEFLFGDDADDKLKESEEYIPCSCFKLDLGNDAPECQYQGKDNQSHFLTAKDLTREFLKYVRGKAEEEWSNPGRQLGKVVITYPVKFSPAQQEDLRQAAEAAGFPHVELQYEPEAAGYAYYIDGKEKAKNKILVIDWGGGTLDISLITREGKKFGTHRKLSDGDMNMGGEIFDDRLWADVNERMKAKGVTFTPVDARRARPRVRQAKEHLSSEETHTLRLARKGKPVCTLILKRAGFNKLIADSVDKAVDKVQNIISKAAADQKPEMLLLVGGSSRIPLIKEELAAACSLPVCTWPYSREAVARGAAYIAAYDRQDTSTASDAAPEQKIAPDTQSTSMSSGELNALGMRYYRNGNDSTQNFVQAACCFHQAAQQGHAGAQYNLAQCYQKGKGVPKDDQQAFHWFQLAAANGHKGAQSRLIQYNSKGHESLPSSKEGSPEASKSNFQLGREIYCHPAQLHDYPKAAEYFQKGCDEGDVNAMYLLAVSYSTGLGVPRDYDRVLHLGEQLLERGCPLGHAILATALGSGYGCPLDANKAKDHRRKLIQACASPVPGVDDELRYMALFVAEREKNTPDTLHQKQYARKYFSLSKAPERYGWLASALLSHDKEKHSKEILQLLNDGVKANDWNSMFLLGLLLMEPNNGICETDQEQAHTYLRNAARWGGADCSLYFCVKFEQDERENERLQRMFRDSLLYGRSSIRRQNDLNLRLKLVPAPFAAGYRVYEASVASSLLQQGRVDELVSPSGPPTLRVTNERSESLSGLQLRICAPKQGLDKTFPVSQTIKAHETLEFDLNDLGLTNDDSDLNIRISAPDGRYSEMVMSVMSSLAAFVNDAIPPLLLYWEKGLFGGFVLKIQCLSEGEQIHNINVIKTSNQAHCGQPFDMNGNSAPVSVGWAEMSDSAGLKEGEMFIITCDEYAPIVAQILTTPGDQSSSGWENIAKMGAAAAAIAASVRSRLLTLSHTMNTHHRH